MGNGVFANGEHGKKRGRRWIACLMITTRQSLIAESLPAIIGGRPKACRRYSIVLDPRLSTNSIPIQSLGGRSRVDGFSSEWITPDLVPGAKSRAVLSGPALLRTGAQGRSPPMCNLRFPKKRPIRAPKSTVAIIAAPCAPSACLSVGNGQAMRQPALIASPAPAP